MASIIELITRSAANAASRKTSGRSAKVAL